MKTRSATVAALVAIALASGCATSRKFQCPAPNGVSCMSTLELYDATNDSNQVSMRTDRSTPRPPPARAGRSVRRTHSTPAFDAGIADRNVPMPRERIQALPAQPVAPMTSDAETPLRTPARTLRVWIKPYETDSGDLNLGGYVMTEIEPRRWRVGNTQDPAKDRMVYPLEAEAAMSSLASEPAPPSSTSAPADPTSLSIDE